MTTVISKKKCQKSYMNALSDRMFCTQDNFPFGGVSTCQVGRHKRTL